MNNNSELSPKALRVWGLFGVVFGSIFVLAGIFVLGRGLLNGYRQFQTSDWASVTGQFENDGRPTRIESRDGYVITQEDQTSPFSRYRYVIDDKVYYGSRVIFTDEINLDSQEVYELSSGHNVSGEVTVYYSRSDPANSVLIKGFHAKSFKGVGFGSLFAGFALFWITMWWGMSVWLPNRMAKIKNSG